MATKTKEDLSLIAHLLRRAGFGASYDQWEAYAALGYEDTVEELLHPENQPPLEEDLPLRFANWGPSSQTPHQQRTYWFYKMINSRRPLEEKVALFWHSVLCTGNGKLEQPRSMRVTVDLFRRFGLGSFRELLIQIGQDPGMIYYLDNCMSHKGAINENWGRELLELFSMGVDNYTEDDVKQAARAFTGWTNAPTFPPYPYGRADKLEFRYDPTSHDDGQKMFLGYRGRLNGEDIVDLICQQPATARFLARQLYSFFVADEPPVPQWANIPPRDPEALNILATAYVDYRYDMRSMLRTLFNSDFFKEARFNKVKSPVEVVVGTVKLAKDFTSPSPDLIDVVNLCGYMGQELYDPPSVEGWHTGQEWIDSGTLVERVNFLSGQLGDPTKPGVREIAQRLRVRGQVLSPQDLVDGCAEQLGSVGFSDETKKTLVEFAQRDGPINTGSQQFTNRVAAMLALIVATKEYQFN